jgi:hypothetical protein
LKFNIQPVIERKGRTNFPDFQAFPAKVSGGKKGEMKNEEWCITLPEDKSVIKVGSPDRENGRVPYPGVSLWAKRFWRIVYWWRIHCQTPNWKSPQWVALGCALLLMVAVVAVTSAYLIEPARRQPVAGRSSASGGSTVDGRGELGTAVPT